MSSLTKLAKNSKQIRQLLEDPTVGHSTAARDINKLYGEDVTTESSVRRYRSKNDIALIGLVSPNRSDSSLEVRPRRELPVQQWQPGIDYDLNEGGEFRTRPIVISSENTVEPEEAELLQEFGLDPKVWEITAARKSQWQSGDNWLEAQKVSFKKRGSGFSLSADEIQQALTASTGTRKASKTPVPRTVVIPAGDLQLGKQDGGGTAATIERFARITNDQAEYLEQLGGVANLVLPWLGDCIEGSVSQGGRNIVSLDLTPAEQVRVYRRLMMHQIATLAPLGGSVLIPVVPGNHDETTRQQNMPHRDSWAIEGAVAVRDWMDGRPEYEHVRFIFPDPTEPDLTVDIAGVTVTFMHGHGTGKSRPDGVLEWWKRQSHGRQLAGQADLLISAHWHHLRVEASGGNRTWLQIPALDGGSDWYRHLSGEEHDSGIVSLELTPGTSPNWNDLRVWT